MPNVLRLVRASATFPELRGSSDVVRAGIAEAYIACQNIASAVAVFERAILAVPIHTISAYRDHRAPWSLGALRVSWTEAYRCKSGGSHQNRSGHISNLHAGPHNLASAVNIEPISKPSGEFGSIP